MRLLTRDGVFTATHLILSRDWNVTVDGFWIDDRIYWTLRYSACLQFTIHYYIYTHTHTHTLVFTVTFLLAVAR
jgi:hypothetical protein